MTILRLFKIVLSIFDKKKNKGHPIIFVAPSLSCRKRLKLFLGVDTEISFSFPKQNIQEKIKMKNSISLSDEEVIKISKSARKEVTNMKLVSGTRGLNNVELDAYYKNLGIVEMSEERKEETRKIFRDAFNSVRKGH